MHHTSTDTLILRAQRIWVLDGERIFCIDGNPYAFSETEIILKTFGDNTLGMVRLLHFSDDVTQVFAIDHAKIAQLIDSIQGEFIAYRHAVAVIDSQTAHEISAGIQLLLWQKNHQFCGHCGHKTLYHDKENVATCPACHQTFYPKIQPCVIIAITRHCPITNKLQILLAQHHRHKDTGMYGLIAGFMEVGESVEMTIHREVSEETGLRVNNIRYIKSQAWPYPTNLMLGFCATYQSGSIVIDKDELSHAQFFSKDELPLIPKQGTIAHELIWQALS